MTMVFSWGLSMEVGVFFTAGGGAVDVARMARAAEERGDAVFSELDALARDALA